VRGGVSADHGDLIRQVLQRFRPARQDCDRVAGLEGQIDDMATGGAGRTEDEQIHGKEPSVGVAGCEECLPLLPTVSGAQRMI
jgi:hypothetical protein